MTVLKYTESALKDLKKIDKKVARRIVDKIKKESEKDNPIVSAKVLQGVLAGFYRYRIGDYRVIFEVDDHRRITILTILRIKHRKDIFKGNYIQSYPNTNI